MIKNLTKKFGNKPVLNEVSLEVREGEFLALIGENGSGKTTLLKTLATILKPNSGDAFICEHSLVAAPLEVRKVVGYCAENLIYDELTVRENVGFYLNIYSKIREVKFGVDSGLEDFGLLGYADEKTSNLSKGYRQRLGIAITILTNPKVLLLDEPYSNLDAKSAKMLEEKLSGLKGKVTILMATHDLSRLDMCDSVAILSSGKIEKCTVKDAEERMLNSKVKNNEIKNKTENKTEFGGSSNKYNNCFYN